MLSLEFDYEPWQCAKLRILACDWLDTTIILASDWLVGVDPVPVVGHIHVDAGQVASAADTPAHQAHNRPPARLEFQKYYLSCAKIFNDSHEKYLN